MDVSRDPSSIPLSPIPHPRNPSRTRSEQREQGSLAWPDRAAVGEDAVELMHDFVHSHRHHEETFESQEDYGDTVSKEDLDQRRRLPWFKRPSALWFMVMIPIIIAAYSTTDAARIEVVTDLVCRTLRPEYMAESELPAVSRAKLCNSDPVVQAATAKFFIVLNIIRGALGCLTTAWWGSLSDRRGRVATMRICFLGLLATEAVFICVFELFGHVQGGYWLLLLGPCIDGLLGGFSAGAANIHAYIADCTEPAKRSRTFSLFAGLSYCGTAIGPALGSLIIRRTRQVKSVFYFTIAIHLCYEFMLWLVVPESLFRCQMARACRTHFNSKAAASRNGRYSIERLFGFLTPLSLFVPTHTAGTHFKRRDWNLTLLAAAYGCTIMLSGSFTYKLQYASLKFGWDSEMLGYWMSIEGITRALFLIIILPTVISLFKSKPPILLYSAQPELLGSEAHQSSSASELSPYPEMEPLQPSKALGHDHGHHTPTLDLNIVRVSLILEIVVQTLIALATTGGVFIFWGAMGSFGAGFGPAVQSLSLTIYTSRGGSESGRLFGALSVITALCGQMFSPLLFGLVYAATVGTFPQAIFVVLVAGLSCSVVLVSLIHLPEAKIPGEEEAEATELLLRDFENLSDPLFAPQ